MSMKIFLKLLCFALLLPSISHAALPEKYVGVWATDDSVFKDDMFLGGLAFYVSRDGDAVLLGGPMPPPNCENVACAKISAMRTHVAVGKNQASILLESKDMSGKLVSGIGFTYDENSKSLRGQSFMLKGKTLFRRAVTLSDADIREFSDTLKVREKDIPAGFMTYVVPSRAMVPTLAVGQIVLTDTSIYKKHTPSRGDIVAYESVENQRDIFIQRIVALPGDTVEIRNGKLFIDGLLVEESYAPPDSAQMPYSRDLKPVVVPKDKVFILGDNRDISKDSRFDGPVALKDIVGKVFMVKPSHFEGDFAPIK